MRSRALRKSHLRNRPQQSRNHHASRQSPQKGRTNQERRRPHKLRLHHGFSRSRNQEVSPPQHRHHTILSNSTLSFLQSPALQGPEYLLTPRRPVAVTPLTIETEEEQRLFDLGAKSSKIRKQRNQTALIKHTPNDLESDLIHAFWQRQLTYHDPHNSTRQPSNVHYMDTTVLRTAMYVNTPRVQSLHVSRQCLPKAAVLLRHDCTYPILPLPLLNVY